MATTIIHGYASDYGAEPSDYQTTMPGKSVSDYRLCPLMDLARVVAVGASGGLASVQLDAVRCKGDCCAWYDQTADRCAVLSLARKK